MLGRRIWSLNLLLAQLPAQTESSEIIWTVWSATLCSWKNETTVPLMITWVWLHKLAKHKYRSFKVQTAETSGWLCPSLCTVYVSAMIWVSCYETVLFSSSFWFELWKFSHHSLTYLNKLIWIWWICSQRGNTSWFLCRVLTNHVGSGFGCMQVSTLCGGQRKSCNCQIAS